MGSLGDDANRSGTREELFASTHWSAVLAARDESSGQADQALEELCRTYWYPLYAYVRRGGYDSEDARDLTQSFFAHLLRKDFLTGVVPEKGRFRSFLLACLKHFLRDEWQKTRTLKRRAAAPERLLDLVQAESRYQSETHVAANAVSLYERRWALDLLDRVLNRLREEFVGSGKAVLFDRLQGCLLGERPTETYAQLGSQLGLSETAVKVTVHRLRQRYRELLREEVAHTVMRPEEVDDELRCLFAVVCQ
ncbi:MAG: sigma-70 family RNA polymerase sigma factor [Verrucomicrobiae bacterium]|nr:sigma-70 family RNA polymerase sigma factor [Verrucomicrobiae bacterium]